MIDISLGNSLTDAPWLAIPLVFAGGVATSLTPCIYPMIPITAAIVGGQTVGAPQSKWRTLALTLSYVAGLAAVYAGLGLFAGLTGTLFGSISTNPWALFAQANILILFALMMFDVIPVPIPQKWIQSAAMMDTRGRALGALGMGAASGLVAAPCGAPVFATILTWVSRTQSAGLGFLYLLVFSIGMSTLLVVVGLSSGFATRLPKSGRWMVVVKKLFGLVMLGVGEYYLLEAGKLMF